MIPKNKAVAVGRFLKNHTIEEAMKAFGNSRASIERYERAYRNEYSDQAVNLPKILIFDIETAPIASEVFRVWKENIGGNQIIRDWFMLSWAAKWLFDSEVMSDVLTPEEAKNEDDERISRSMWELLNEADIVVAHNGDKFDLPKLNTRFLVNEINPPLPYRSVDTLKVLKRHFSFTYNSLDWVNKVLGASHQKERVEFELWKEAVRGSQKALESMREYNEQDVYALEDLYMKLRPYIKNHPNTGVYVEASEPICPTCGSHKLSYNGRYATNMNVYQAFRCKDCGSIGRLRQSAISPKQRKQLTSPVAR